MIALIDVFKYLNSDLDCILNLEKQYFPFVDQLLVLFEMVLIKINERLSFLIRFV